MLPHSDQAAVVCVLDLLPGIESCNRCHARPPAARESLGTAATRQQWRRGYQLSSAIAVTVAGQAAVVCRVLDVPKRRYYGREVICVARCEAQFSAIPASL